MGIDLFNGFYRDKTVLVTGHTGFKGSWLSIWLHELGANVIGYSLDPYTDKDNFVITNLKNRIVDIRSDIRDENKLNNVFAKYKPQVVFHLAAQPLVKLSFEKPKETYDINVMGTLNVLECIRKSESVKVGVMITTDKCYENKEQIWPYRENDPMGGYDPYSSSKGCCELLIASYRNSFMNPKNYENHGKAIASVRAGNVIGGGDWAKDRIIPDSIRALQNKNVINVRNPKAIRPWQHVLEPLSGYMELAKDMYSDGVSYSNGWNFGPDYKSLVPVSNIVDLVISNWGSGNWQDVSDKNAPHEANLLSLDCTKARTYLNWQPRLNINQTIKLTVDWYKYYLNNFDIYDFDVSQIQSYVGGEMLNER